MSKVGETLTKEQTKAGWKRLTAKQQKFLDNFMYRDMTQTASAREAGYSNPTVDAVRLLRNPVVQERYQEMRMEANAKFGVTVEKSVRDLLKMRNEAWDNGKIGEAIRAEELRLKATGLLVNKQHVMHEDMNSLSREQIIEKLEEFKTVFPDIETTILYDTPNYKIWVGGYRTRLEVDNALVAIKKEFPAAFKTKPIQKIE